MAADAKSDAAILAGQVRGGDRRALARAITLVESTRADHRETAERLVAALLPDTGRAIRVGISGPPGAGKSTFIEAFGLHLLDAGRTPAVLAVDPSSPVSGGSILGDKTRMEFLSRDERAFIRPSPSSGTLGGVARRTREAALVCEAAGFDTLLIETVGVGQSETAVAEMVDLFMLLLPPAGGDELQGIKKGIVELADLVVINKDDGDLAPAASRTAAEYGAALHMLRPATSAWHPPVLRVSALHRRGMGAVWGQVLAHRDALGRAGLAAKRAGQARAVLWREIEEEVRGRLAAKGPLAGLLDRLEYNISQGFIGPAEAARKVVDALAKPGS